ncbi:hypothetical protein NIES1031_14440 [Chroogloeocystis siderophila 5.2 s.c.1]|uniref:Uncharacterized protein n=2 Tax=Chroogloeocystis TaxID=329162 RepID=A0A1U7HNB1_9CHRO|nr:hypothetical protein NIES1031_14440 [Chroogloeocystis siderophila 5.2 s.c.1]
MRSSNTRNRDVRLTLFHTLIRGIRQKKASQLIVEPHTFINSEVQMNNPAFTWLINCILFGSMTVSAISISEISQAQSAPPNRPLDGPETTVANFHKSLQTVARNGNINSLNKYYCSVERVLLEQGDPRGRSTRAISAYLQMASLLRSYSLDTSRLYYETKYYDPKQGRAIVAITGNVLLRTSNNQALVMPYRRFNTFGRDWLRLIKENNQWKLCYNLVNPFK